jgi:hypothetical protein
MTRLACPCPWLTDVAAGGRAALEQQIKNIRKGSESRLEMLKKEEVQVESELEEVRYEASFAGVQSSKEHKKQLAQKQQRLRQMKEKAEATERLEQRVVAGLAHVSDILFLPKSEEDASVLSLVREIEAVLDTLMNEREKQLQQQQGGASTANGGRDSASAVVRCRHLCLRSAEHCVATVDRRAIRHSVS